MNAFVDYPPLQKFLLSELSGVFGIEAEPGMQYGAATLFVAFGDPMHTYFVTDKSSRKCQPLFMNTDHPASVVIGTVKGVEFSLQMSGQARMLADKTECVKKYLDKFPEPFDDPRQENYGVIDFKPEFILLTDYRSGGHEKFVIAPESLSL